MVDPRSDSLTIKSSSEEETVSIGIAVGAVLQQRDVVLLSGELGAGKTRFVEGMTQGIESAAETRSPTFVLVNEYVGRIMLAHCDLYRLSGPEEIIELGLDDYLDRGAALAVEWPERARGEFPKEALGVHLGFGEAPDDRVLDATAVGDAANRLLQAMRAAAGIGQHAGGGQ
jgi:tRNA threonylcarbamoyladenosine biosynthesis protein TsaE